jgi:hypothetical protein
MSDEQQEVDLEALANQEEEVQQEQDEVKLSDFEQKQYDEGWRPLEEFSGPEENWKTAKEFARDGEWIQKINSLKHEMDNQKQEFNSRLENTNKLHEARRQAEIKQLKEQQRAAVDMSDTDAFDNAQKQIDELEKQPVTSEQEGQPQKDPAIVAWEAKNPWIMDANDERSSVAMGVWNTYLNQNQNATISQALAHVDERMNSLYPANNSNPRRQQPNSVENTQRKPGRQSKNLTMNDLTPEERQEWNLFGSTMFTEEQFLKTVADTRTK